MAMTSFKKPGLKKISLSASMPSCSYSLVKDSLINISMPVPNMTLTSMSTSAYKSLQLQARAFESQNYKYHWQPSFGINNPNISNPIFNYYQSQNYYITLISPEGCISTDTLKVRVFDSSITDIFVPKSFTPNGDGNNDILYPYIAGIQSFHYFKVFDKFGQMVYESRNATEGWDGTKRGSKLPMDVYLWMAEGTDQNGQLIQKTGNILLIR